MIETPGAAWLRCAPYLEAALECSGETHALDDVRAGVEAGDYHFWPGQACAVVTEFQDSPRKRTLNVWLAGGDLRELRAMMKAIEPFASAHGCSRIMAGGVFGRTGWERVGRALGFEPRWTLYAKDLTL